MHTHTAKQEALEAIARLPDTVDFEEIVYRLYVIKKIHQGCWTSKMAKASPVKNSGAKSNNGDLDASRLRRPPSHPRLHRRACTA